MAQPLDLGSPAVLKDLNAKLLSHPYVSGYVASGDDVTVFAGMPEAPSSELPNLKRWHAHITALLRKSFPGIAAQNILPADEAAVDAHFQKRSYVTLFQPSMDDFAAHVGMSAEPSRAAPHAARWYRHVAGILDDRFPGDAAGLTVKAALAGGAKPSYTVDWPMMDKARKNGLDAKKIKAANKEGGKKGVEIEGAADMGGLEFFCTRIQAAEGNIDLLDVAMEGMNAVPDPDNSEERKGCSGHIGKLIISDDEKGKCVAMVAYVPDAQKKKINAAEWMQAVCDTDMGGGVGGEVMPGATATYARCVAKEDTAKGFFYLKMKDNTLSAAIQYLRAKGLFNDEDSDDEMEENPAADFDW